MAEAKQPQDEALELLARLRQEAMGAAPAGTAPPAPGPATPPPPLESTHVNQLLTTMHDEWDLTNYEVQSKRKNFSALVTAFKKVLDQALKPYVNIFIVRQATFNSHTVQLLTVLADKLNRLEDFLGGMAQEQREIKHLVERKIDETHQKLDRLAGDLRLREEELDRFIEQGFAGNRQELEHMENQLMLSMQEQQQLVQELQEKLRDQVGEGLRLVLTDVSRRLVGLQQLMEQNRQESDAKLEQNIDLLLELLTAESQAE